MKHKITIEIEAYTDRPQRIAEQILNTPNIAFELIRLTIENSEQVTHLVEPTKVSDEI